MEDFIGRLFLTFGVPLFFLLIGVVLKYFPPKKINYFYGYRTEFATKNEDVFKEANRYSADLFILFSILLFVINVIMFIFNVSSAIMGISFGIYIIPLFISIIYLTEKHLHKIFDENGVRRGYNSNRSYKVEEVGDLNHINSKNAIKTEKKYVIYLSVLIFAISTVINLILYVKLPPQVYIHFGLTGNPDEWVVEKTIAIVVDEIILILGWIGIFLPYYCISQIMVSKFLPVLLILIYSLFELVIFDTLYYNIYKIHASNFVIFITIILMIFVVLIFSLLYEKKKVK
ncbi:MAG TPA: hypothetical protein GXX15_12985 [Clostridia bacterium]|nr:hypothetical protein [Clostridia bacterium]